MTKISDFDNFDRLPADEGIPPSMPYPSSVMINIENISIKQLKRAIAIREQIELLRAELNHVLGGDTAGVTTAQSPELTTPAALATRGKRKMSASARAVTGAAQKSRLAKKKGDKIPVALATVLDQLEHGAETGAFEAAKLLSDRRGVNLIASLTRVLRSGVQAYSREAAAYALSWHADRKAAEALLPCAADPSEQDSVRAQATEGLAMHLEWASPKTMLRLKAEGLMMQMLDSPSPTLRFWACFGLGSLRCQTSIPRLIKLAKEDASVCPGWWFVSEEAEDALEWIAGRPGKCRTAVHLREATNSESRTPPIRRAARLRAD